MAARGNALLGTYLDGYIAGRTDAKARTIVNLKQSRGYLVEFFGCDRSLRAITPGDADEYQRWLLSRVGTNTAARHCGRAKQFFRAAVRKQLIRENPFADLKGCAVKANPERQHFVSREVASKVLDACPNSQWRLLFALARFGGLRCPSEVTGLRWSDINWAGSRMTVRSPKTERHEGRESRVVPIFAELRTYLDAAWGEAPDGAEFVLTIGREQGSSKNFRTRLERIIATAGLTPWPKLFQNLRSTRQTELEESFPSHVVCQWLGNSQAVARRHYLQVTEDHFTRAVAKPGEAARNPARATVAGSDSESLVRECGEQESDYVPAVPILGDCCTNEHMPPVGLEPTT
ncbi:MAG: tyrosine-type recombinase/integrase [Pirellulales bacterium]|nr:tyrosine-type recombinase/integrase [Pirellulales bacterium]